MKRNLSLILLGWLIWLPVQAKVTEFQLDNGLKILVKEDHRAPVAVQQVWYRVGSNYEHSGVTGLSHMLEHLMFKGTKSVGPGEFSKMVSKMGGKENAFTTSDYTVYYQVVGKQHLETVMKLEADRMQNLVIKEDAFQKERQVVIEERRWRTEDRPTSKLYEQFNATAFMNSPARQPTIGWMQDIQNYTLQDIQKWYQKWYAPNNATLVVAGDVNPLDIYAWAKKYYGKYPARKLLKPKPQQEIEQLGPRKIVMYGATQSPTMLLGFHVPSLHSAESKLIQKDVYTLSVISSLLDGDDSARFTKNLVRKKQSVVGGGVGYDGFARLETLFLFQAIPSEGKQPEEVEADIWTEIEKLKTTPVSKKELNRVLAQAEAQYIYQQDSIESQANLLGELMSVGLPIDTAEKWIAHLRQVTVEDIQRVANTYFKKDKETFGLLLSNGETAKKNSGNPFPSGALR